MRNNFVKPLLIALVFSLAPQMAGAQNFTLRVVVKDDAGSPVNDAVIHHNGFSPQLISNGVYYFTTSDSGLLTVERAGYVTDAGIVNTQLQNVAPGTAAAPTVIEISSNNPCAAGTSIPAGGSVVCARLSPTLTLTIKKPLGENLTDATVRVYTDLSRSNLADDLTNPGSSDGQKTTDAMGKAAFALASGRYYVRAERFGFNDVNTVLDVSNSRAKLETLTLPNAGAGITSPSRSQAVLTERSAPADGNVSLTVKIYDGNGDALGRRAIKVVSSRSEDTITPSTGTTNSDGVTAFLITTSRPGESTFVITTDGTMLSTFPKVTFTVSAAMLASPNPSATESDVEASISPVASNGEATVTVIIKNAGGAALSGKRVSLASSRGDDDSFLPASATSDASGMAAFMVKSGKAGTSVITVQAEGVTLNKMAVITFSPAGKAPSATLAAGSLLKSALNPAVYFYGSDGARHAFPNENIYKSWYADFSAVRTVSPEELAAIPLGKNVTYRPGVKMIKLQTVPKVYAIGRGGVLRWVEGEEIARALYGNDWNKKIDDLSDAFFTNYREGASVKSASDFTPASETASAPTPDNSM